MSARRVYKSYMYFLLDSESGFGCVLVNFSGGGFILMSSFQYSIIKNYIWTSCRISGFVFSLPEPLDYLSFKYACLWANLKPLSLGIYFVMSSRFSFWDILLEIDNWFTPWYHGCMWSLLPTSCNISYWQIMWVYVRLYTKIWSSMNGRPG